MQEGCLQIGRHAAERAEEVGSSAMAGWQI